jgi:hypothetical protein
MFLLGRQRWKEALKASEQLTHGKWVPTRVVGHTLAGDVYLALGDKERARKSLASAEQELAQVPTFVGGINVNRAAVQPYVDTLRGQLLLRDGQAAEGRAMLKDVQQRLRALPGPDAWIQALFRLEHIARTARDAGDWELAEYTAQQMIDHDAAYAGSHFALALVAQHSGDVEVMQREAASARTYWKDADRDLLELTQLRKLEARTRLTQR